MTHRILRWARNACWIGLCLFGLGCATTGVVPQQRISVVPPQAAASQYITEASGAAFATGDLSEIAKQGLADAHAQGAPVLTPDDRLGVLARYAAEYWEAHGQSPNHATLDFLAHHLGLPEPAPHLALMKSPADELAEHVAEEIVQLTARGQYTHVGLYAQSAGFVAQAVVVLSFRHLMLEPLPRAVEVGAHVALKGKLNAGFLQPTLVLVSPDGQSVRTALGHARAFSTTLTLAQPGEYRVELLGEGKQGIVVAANFPVFVGIAPPDHIEVTSISPESLTPESLAERLRELANADRKKVGAMPLQADDALAAVAHAHNQDMIDHGFVGHTSPTTGTAADRVERAGQPASLVLENIGRDYSAEELEEGWMSSPGHRANLLHPQATHIGIDARILPSGDDGPPQILATEVFIRRTPPLPDDPAGALLGALNEARKQAGASAIDLDEALSSTCQKTAERYFAQPNLTSSMLLAELQKKQVKDSPPGKRIASTMMLTTDLMEIAKASQLHTRDITAIGLGIAQGRRPKATGDEIVVVISLVYR